MAPAPKPIGRRPNDGDHPVDPGLADPYPYPSASSPTPTPTAPVRWWRSSSRLAAVFGVFVALVVMNLVVEPRIADWTQPTRAITYWVTGLAMVALVSFAIQRTLRWRGWPD